MEWVSYYKKMSVRFFSGIVDSYMDNFKALKPHLEGAGIPMLLKTWVCVIFLSSAIAYAASLALVVALVFLIELHFYIVLYMVVLLPVLVASLVFFIFYIYPIQKAKSVQNEIENNLPFALANMSAIMSSGIPPEHMFDMLTDYDEYGNMANSCKMIVRNIKTFGMSSVRAIADVADKTPSQSFKQILMGIATTIEKGGNLVEYIKQMSDKSLFEYGIKREKYLKTLSTYADIYTALLVAAPLMMLSVLGVMGIIGGSVMGLSINDLITLTTFAVLPALNVIFLAFIHMTYPGV